MVEQIAIAVFGVLATLLSQSHAFNVRRFASIFGLISQPFWFYTSYKAEQWGIFWLSFMYTFSWGLGFYSHWMRRGEVA